MMTQGLFLSMAIVLAEPEGRLMEVMADRANPIVAERVAAALQLVDEELSGDEEAAEVRRWLEEEREPWVRYYLMRALVDWHDEEDGAFIAGYLRDSDPTLRAVAADWAADNMGPGIETRVIAALRDEEIWWVRAALIRGLGESVTDDALEALHAALEDPVAEVQALAIAAVRERADRRSASPLMRLLGSEPRGVVPALLEALGELGEPAAIPIVERAARREDAETRRAAASALGMLEAAASWPLLVRLLEDPDSRVARAAAASLIALGAGDATADILTYLADHPDENLMTGLIVAPGAGGMEARRTCDLMSAPGTLIPGLQERVSALCRELQARTESGVINVTTHWLSAGSTFGITRTVDDPGARPFGWVVAPGSENGGLRVRLEPGAEVAISAAAWYRGETWLLVDSDSAIEEVWVRETDLRVLPLEPE